MAEKGDSSLQSLDDFKDLEPSGGNAKVRSDRKVKEQKWSSNDRAESLLADINSLLGNEAEEEEERLRAEIRAREDAERREREEAEARKRREGEQRLAEEKARVEAIEKRRTMMAEAIKREDAIAAGEIDPEAEAREAAEAEARARAESEARVQKDQALTDAQRLIEEQKQALQRLTEVSMQPVPPPTDMAPKKSNALPIVLLVVVLLGAGIAAVLVLQNNKNTEPEKLPAPKGVVLTFEGGSAVPYEVLASYQADKSESSPALTSAVEVHPLFDPEDEKQVAAQEQQEEAPKKKRRRRSSSSSSKKSSKPEGSNSRLKNLKLRGGGGGIVK